MKHLKKYKVRYKGWEWDTIMAYSAKGARTQAWDSLINTHGWSKADFMKNAKVK